MFNAGQYHQYKKYTEQPAPAIEEIGYIQTFHFLTSGHWHNEIHIGNLEKN